MIIEGAKFTDEQIKSVVEELRQRSARIKEFSANADTLHDELTFVGYSDALNALCDEIVKNGGLTEWL